MDGRFLELHRMKGLPEVNPRIEGLCVAIFSRQAMLDQEGTGFMALFRLHIGVNFCVVDPDNFLAYDDKVLSGVLLDQLFLMVFEVFKLLLQHDS